MTTPSPQGQANTTIQLNYTHQAYLAFSDVVQALSPIANDANDYPARISNLAMQSPAGRVFSSAVAEWVSNFNSLWGGLEQITRQLETQYATMLAAENHNVNLADTAIG